MDLHNIREMQQSDWVDVARIYRDGINSGISTFSTSCPTYAYWDKTHIKVCRFVITHEDTVVGWTALMPVNRRCAYAGVAELSIYLDGNYHGKGYGTQLLRHLVGESEKYGYWMLQSGILQNNTASIALHRKCGFRQVGIREKIARDRTGIWQNTVLMERRSNLREFD